MEEDKKIEQPIEKKEETLESLIKDKREKINEERKKAKEEKKEDRVKQVKKPAEKPAGRGITIITKDAQLPTVCIKGLPPTTEADVKGMVEKLCGIKNIDCNSNKFGSWYLKFKNINKAEEFAQKLDGSECQENHRKLNVYVMK